MLQLFCRLFVILISGSLFLITALTTIARLDTASSTALAYDQFKPGLGHYLIYSDSLRSLQIARKNPLSPMRLDNNYSLGAPDGRQYIVSRSSSRGVDLFVMQSDRSLRPLTYFADFPDSENASHTMRFNSYPVWSPDSRWVAFISMDAKANMDIYVIQHDGSQLHRVAQDIGTPMPLNLHWAEIQSQNATISLLLFAFGIIVLTIGRPLPRQWLIYVVSILHNR